MIPTYASFRSQPLADFTLSSIAGSVPELTRNFYISFHNRAGRSLLSNPQSIYSTGVRLTLNNGLILDSEEVFWVVISAETTGDPRDAAILAMWKARDNNQSTRRSLPISIDFTTEEHFRVARAVTDVDSLPSSGILDGAIALDVSTGIYYRYDSESYGDSEGRFFSYGAITKGQGYWVEYQGNFNGYLESTSGVYGSDQKLITVPNALKVPPKIGASASRQQRCWINNGLEADGGSPIVTGKYTLDIAVDGVPGYEAVFANKTRYYLRGYVNRDTLALDTAISTVGEPKLWNPTDGLIVLPAELPRNHAAVYDLELVFDNDDLIGLLPQNSTISIDIVEVQNIRGMVSPIAKVIGDLVFSDLDKLLIVPGLKRLSGIASIGTGFMIEARNEQLVTGLVADTANQRVTLTGSLNGLAAVKSASATLGYSEVLRATVSTEPGISELRQCGSVVLANNAIALTIAHPLTVDGAGIIRSDYPDTLIAGNNKARFTPIYAYVFLALESVFYRSSLIQVTATATQVINLDQSDFTVISSLPVQADESFGLFAPTSATLASSGSGSLTGNATAYFAYAYESPNQIETKINNQPIGSIPTARVTLAEAINNSNALVKTENLADLLDKAIARDNLDVDVRTKLKEIAASYTVTAADHRHILDFTNTNDVILTLNHTTLNLTSDNLFEVIVRRLGSGQVTIAIAGGATLESLGSALANLYDSIYFVYKSSTNSWAAIGNLS